MHFLYSCWGLQQGITPLSLFLHAASSCRKHLMSGPSFGEGPRSRSAGDCPAAWSSSDIDSRSQKVTCQCDPLVLCLGDQAWLPSPSEALQHLWLYPQDLRLGWSQLWEQGQMFSCILVVDQQSLSICCSNIAAAVSACWWASMALANSCSPKGSCLSLLEALSQWWHAQELVGSRSPPPSN